MQTGTAKQSTNEGGESESEVLKANKILIRYLALPFVQNGIALDDLMQEGSLALLGAARTFRVSEGVKLSTYAYKFILGALFRYVTRERTEPAHAGLAGSARSPSDDGVDGQIETIIEKRQVDTSTPADTLETAELVAVAARELSFLSDDERRILRMRFGDELDVRAMAEILNKSKSDVDRIYHGAIAKLRERVGARV